MGIGVPQDFETANSPKSLSVCSVLQISKSILSSTSYQEITDASGIAGL
jgi:hypothetical protein